LWERLQVRRFQGWNVTRERLREWRRLVWAGELWDTSRSENERPALAKVKPARDGAPVPPEKRKSKPSRRLRGSHPPAPHLRSVAHLPNPNFFTCSRPQVFYVAILAPIQRRATPRPEVKAIPRLLPLPLPMQTKEAAVIQKPRRSNLSSRIGWFENPPIRRA
jgi:hypothetical protein